MHPEIILFDEVTASLDPEMVREVLELINDLAQEDHTNLLANQVKIFFIFNNRLTVQQDVSTLNTF